MAVTTNGLVLEYVAKLAQNGTAPGNNTDHTSTWDALVGGAGYDAALYTGAGGFAWDPNSGWDGDGSAGDPYALVGDGASDYVTIPSGTAVNPTGDFSFEFWYYQPATPAANEHIFGNYTSTGYLGVDCYIDTSGHWVCRVGDGAAAHYVLWDTSSCVGAAWHHFAITFDVDTTTFIPYFDSTADSSAVYAYSPRTGVSSYLLTNNAGTTTWSGGLATFRAYSKTLSSDEVLANYNAGVTAASTDSGFTGMRVTHHITA